MYTEKLTINLKKLIKAGLSIEQHFLLDCIYRDDSDLMIEYVQSIGKLDKPAIDKLIQAGYLVPIEGEITFSKFKLTKKAVEYLGVKVARLDHKRFWAELREVYPKSIKVGKGKRSLHTDIEKTAEKYKAIVESEDHHKLILKCAKLYLKELEDTNRMEFIQMLSTWVNQKIYQTYIDEAIELKDEVELGSNEDDYNLV